LRGEKPADAAQRAVDAASSTITHPGGRPALKPWW
jgi:hypothetical protein